MMRRLMQIYNAATSRLTRQEQLVLCVVLALLLTGWVVKTCRLASARPASTQAPRR